MNSRKLTILVVAAIGVLAIGLWLAYPRPTSIQSAQQMYPDLKPQVDKVTAIRIFKAGDSRAIELTLGESQWQVAERSGYPADTAKVRRLLLSLADAKPVEEKTSNPENYSTLGVEDVSQASATGVRVELAGTDHPVSLIVGKAAGTKGSYVRRAGESASWLTSETIEAAAEPRDWLASSIIDVGADRVQSATISVGTAKPYTAAKATRADADFKVEGIAKGAQPEAFVVNNFASTLAAFTLADVRPASDFASDKPAATAVFRTFDGLVVNLQGWLKDDKHYVAITTAYDSGLAKQFRVEAAPATEGKAKPEDKVEETVARTNARANGYVYEIADYKYESIFKPAAALVRK